MNQVKIAPTRHPIRTLSVHLVCSNHDAWVAFCALIAPLTIELVGATENADLIVFNDIRDVACIHPDKKYLYFPTNGSRLPEPVADNIIVLQEHTIEHFLSAVQKAIDELPDGENIIVEQPDMLAPPVLTGDSFFDNLTNPPPTLKAGALCILAISSAPQNIASAKTGLAGHRLNTATTYEEARSILATSKFDVVLIDLHLTSMSEPQGKVQSGIPVLTFGTLIMLEAALTGSKEIAGIIASTDTSDTFLAAFRHSSRSPFTIEGSKERLLQAKLLSDGSINWADAMHRLQRDL